MQKADDFTASIVGNWAQNAILAQLDEVCPGPRHLPKREGRGRVIEGVIERGSKRGVEEKIRPRIRCILELKHSKTFQERNRQKI